MHADSREQGQWATDEAEHHHGPREQSGSPHQVAQENPVAEPGAELRAEKASLVMHSEQSPGSLHHRPAVAGFS
jgi:hypothetical protein